MFIPVEKATALLKSNGVYRVAAVYEFDGRLYAKWGIGYISLSHHNRTSHQKVRLETLSLPFKETHNDVGFLINPTAYKSKKAGVANQGDYNETRAYLDKAKVCYTVDKDGFLHLTSWLDVPRGQNVTLDGIKSGNVDVWERATYNGPNHTAGCVVVWQGATFNARNHTTGYAVVRKSATYNGKTYEHRTAFRAGSR